MHNRVTTVACLTVKAAEGARHEIVTDYSSIVMLYKYKMVNSLISTNCFDELFSALFLMSCIGEPV